MERVTWRFGRTAMFPQKTCKNQASEEFSMARQAKLHFLAELNELEKGMKR